MFCFKSYLQNYEKNNIHNWIKCLHITQIAVDLYLEYVKIIITQYTKPKMKNGCSVCCIKYSRFYYNIIDKWKRKQLHMSKGHVQTKEKEKF